MVLPIIDYAAVVWYAKEARGSVHFQYELAKVQRLGARQILRAFKMVSLKVLEAEASLEPTETRLHRIVSRQAAKLAAIPPDNPLAVCVRGLHKTRSKFVSPLRTTFHLVHGSVQYCHPTPPWIVPPWIDTTNNEKVGIAEEAIALQTDQIARRRGVVLYSDASVRNRLVGYAVVAVRQDTIKVLYAGTTGKQQGCTVRSAELAGIREALRIATEWTGRGSPTQIVTDSQAALKAIRAGNANTRDRGLLADIWRLLNGRSSKLRLRWVPAHKGALGNERADAEAKATTVEGRRLTLDRTKRVMELNAVLRTVGLDRTDNPNHATQQPRFGKYTWALDKALPGKHTLLLYGALSSAEASILIQARTGWSKLNASLHAMRVADSADCECGRTPETTRHVLLECSQWHDLRTTFRAEVGQHWNDLSFVLGGWSPRRDLLTNKLIFGPREKWRANLKVVRATLRFLAATGRFSTLLVGG